RDGGAGAGCGVSDNIPAARREAAAGTASRVSAGSRRGGGSMFTPLGLDHVVLRVRDQQASTRFYVDLLGCTVDHVNERISLVHLRFGEHYIDLLPATAEAPAATAGGVDHVCLSIRCDDLDKARH